MVCIPAYNEESSIAGVIANAKPHADHIIVCDDGSKDKTAEVAKKMGAEVFSNPHNMGKGAALNVLLDYAKSQNPDVVVTIDADGQHDPAEIPRLIEPILSKSADVVVGSRFVRGSSTDAPRYRRFGLRIINALVRSNGLSGVKDTQSGFRAYSRRALEAISWCEMKGFGIEAEQLRKAAQHGMRILEVPISVRYKGVRRPSTKNPAAHGLELVSATLKLVAEDRPMLLLGVPGAILVVIGFAFGVNLLLTFNETRYFSVPFALLMMFSIFGGTLLLIASLVLHAISRLSQKIERR
ncbi:MAG: glycosyltransferase family 2 protein [Candidatus Methanosuratincola petrocarbonis]